MRRGRSRIQEEIVQALDSDRAQLVREIVDDAGERAVQLAEEASSAARSAGGILPVVGGILLSGGRILRFAGSTLVSAGRVLLSARSVVPTLVRRDRGHGRRRTAILIALGAIVVAVGIVVTARRLARVDDDDDGRERAMDDALMDSFPASDPPAPATAPRL